MALRKCILLPCSDHNFAEIFSKEAFKYIYQTAQCHNQEYHNINLIIIIIIIIIVTAIGLSPGSSGYVTCIQDMKLVTTKFKSRGLHEKHVVATWNVGNHLSICL
jgi:hypothetical protein